MITRELLVLGGGAEVGKSNVGWEVSPVLRARGTAHCPVEGDYLDRVHPAPADDPHRTGITERNLASVWANYAALGQHRLVCTNTVSVRQEPMIRRATGPGAVRSALVRLTASEATTRERLARREIGSQLAPHVERSLAMARRLDADAPPGTVRIATDGSSVEDIAHEVVPVAGR
ncbi:hypothetical protein [Saccharothrix saharensis]|uniref:hypothetical protein n=1 Tax=Saccharothrix saharensis TaxID=571190 RepID=UPI001478540D|nr:hypothetical protein [Saccharothrix saharensis]